MQKAGMYSNSEREANQNNTVSGLLTTPKIEEIRKRSRSFTNCLEITAELENHEQVGFPLLVELRNRASGSNNKGKEMDREQRVGSDKKTQQPT